MKKGVSPKEDKFNQVAEAAIRILASGGPQKLTHSAVARLAKVSRPWVYKYAGNTKKSLMAFALDLFGKSFAELDVPFMATNKSEFLKELETGTANLLEEVKQFPFLLTLYFRWKGDSEIGRHIEKIESLYMNGLSAAFQKALAIKLSQARNLAEVLTTYRLGLLFRWQTTPASQRMSDDQILYLLLQGTKFVLDLQLPN